MSYDVNLVVDVGGPEPVALAILDVNYTYNTGRMLVEAVDLSLAEMHDWTGSAAADLLDRALAIMEADPQRFLALEPDNGWGDLKGWMRFLGEIRDACRIAPGARLYVS